MRGERGLAPAMLVVVIVWALAAVLMLTGTLIAARQIDRRVGRITHITSSIDQNTGAVSLASRTSRTAAKINVAARPLSGDLAHVSLAAHGIEQRAGSILAVAGSINQNAVGIGATAAAIDHRVHSIRSTAAAIDHHARLIRATAGAIGGNVNGILALAQAIGARVRSIDMSVGSIRSRAGKILLTSKSIDAGVAGINLRSDTVIRELVPIKGDLDQVFGQVGSADPAQGHAGGAASSIHSHANSIDCSPLIRPRSTYCGR